MKTEVLIALITAASALLVSSITAILQFIQIRTNHRVDAKVRHQQHNKEVATKRFQEKQEALREACKALQRIQDEIMFLIKTNSHPEFSKSHQSRLTEAVEHLLNTYRDHHSILSEQDRANFDKARKKAVSIMLWLQLEEIDSQETESAAKIYVKELESVNVSIGHFHQQLLLSAVNEVQSLLIVTKELSNAK